LEKIICRIKENSWLARRAAQQLGAHRAAIVWGRTIHLYGADRQEFLQNAAWVRHEVCHVKQFRRHGFLPFLWLYLLEYWRCGYLQNRFEVAARDAEADAGILEGVEFA
jgi:hypothetical protein